MVFHLHVILGKNGHSGFRLKSTQNRLRYESVALEVKILKRLELKVKSTEYRGKVNP